MTIQCCDCKRIRVDGTWKTPAPGFDGIVSHSYCPACAEAFLAAAFSEKASRASAESIRFAGQLLAKAASG